MYYKTEQYNRTQNSIHNNTSSYGKSLLIAASALAVVINIYCGVNAVSQPLADIQQHQSYEIQTAQLDTFSMASR